MASYLIVGAKFRPPALGILAVLANGTPLIARREAQNAFDANAIMVLVSAQALMEHLADHNVVDQALAGYGSSYDALAAQDEWHLGYVPRTDAVVLAPKMDQHGQAELAGTLTFGATGQPRIQLMEDGLC